jgi:phosphoadenosine phosphosulfate reductase
MGAFDLLSAHQKVVLFLSAGKDSLACLLLLRQFWDRIIVAWANPGEPHPRTLAYMARIQSMVPNFVELKGDQPAWIREHGWPADVVPVRRTRDGEAGAGVAAVRFQSYLTCCGANMWRPMQDYLRECGASLVIMGQRADEPMRNRMRDQELQVIDGVSYWQPINSWSAGQVMRFIKACGEELPPFYAEGAESSADCWNCTAYLDHSRGRLAAMRHDEPERFGLVAGVLRAMAVSLQAESRPLFEILEVGS